jgi:hypothetical protein
MKVSSNDEDGKKENLLNYCETFFCLGEKIVCLCTRRDKFLIDSDNFSLPLSVYLKDAKKPSTNLIPISRLPFPRNMESQRLVDYKSDDRY